MKTKEGVVWGLNGGIACGKSTVAALLQQLGARIIDCDAVSRELVEPGTPLLAKIAEQFGNNVLDKQGALRRSYLGKIVFHDPSKLQALNELIHPVIWKRTFALVAQARLEVPLVFIMAPLLFEHGVEAACAGVLVVDISEKKQLERLMARDKLTKSEARERIRSQMSLSAKAERATILIDNNGTLSALRRQVEQVWQERFAPIYGL